MKKTLLLLTGFIFCTIGSVAISQTDSTAAVVEEDFFELSMEDLLNMDVTSVSKKAEKLQDVASSIYVLTSADIMNSGATNLHEALRSVPGYWGVQTQYGHANAELRSSPSFKGNGSVLYLLDGTPIQEVMTSSFSFRNFDIPLSEIDRIEVIRGSGGTVYGANSATGVVNIFTKNPDKYDGVHVEATAASPTFESATLRAGGKINEKLSISAYAKYRSFKGFGTLDQFKGDSVRVAKASSTMANVVGDSVTIANRFQDDFESSKMYSGGVKLAYKLNDKSKLSFNTHMNMSRQNEYTLYDTDSILLPLLVPGAEYSGRSVLIDARRSRVVGNLRFDHDFNENHSLFVRTSTNIENDFVKAFGGYHLSNSIYDLEIQDNLSLGKHNDLSIGANYRLVNFDIKDITDDVGVGYIDPKTTESLNGFFIQDKVKVLDGKLNFTLGLKAETYSLVNDNYYLSPMAKVSFMPVENLTIWGGFTQSYTTPGYNTTNIDFLLVKALSPEAVTLLATGYARQGVYDAVYGPTYAGAIGAGASEVQATAAATAAADGFVASPAGQASIAAAAPAVEQGLASGLPNSIGVINGSATVPTKYQTLEIGFRSNIENKLSVESNFFHTTVTDEIIPAIGVKSEYLESAANPGVFADYTFYGNYTKGTIYGVESMIRIVPTKGTKIEVSHVYNRAQWELQENADFDINDPAVVDPSSIDKTTTRPFMPEHVFRMKGFFDLPYNFSYNIEMMYATPFATQANYQYELQRFPNAVGLGSDNGGLVVGADKSRTIVSMSLNKRLLDDKLTISVFGNDIFNTGMIASTLAISDVTLSQMAGMYGGKVSYKF
jgi:outer membrane cobalamin receptor